MAKAYSLDLRRKVFAAWQEGSASQAQVVVRFGVSASFVRDLAALPRQTGSGTPRPRGGGQRPLATTATRESDAQRTIVQAAQLAHAELQLSDKLARLRSKQMEEKLLQIAKTLT